MGRSYTIFQNDWAIRFAVGSPGGRSSSVWRLWGDVRQTDLYLGVSKICGTLKVSFHRDGKCHLAYKDTLRSPNTFVEKWHRSPFQKEGFYFLYQIFVPVAGLSHSEYSLHYKKNPIHWVQPLKDSQCIEFAIFITDPTIKLTNWPGKNSGTILIDKAFLPQGYTTWVVWRGGDTPKILNPQEMTIPKDKIDVNTLSNKRILIFGKNELTHNCIDTIVEKTAI